MYAFISRTDKRAFVIMRVDDNDAGIKALEAKDVYLLKSEEVYNI